MSEFPHQDFFMSLQRISVGAMTLASTTIPALQIATHIALQYSLRRKLQRHSDTPIPILQLRTQQLPVYTALAQCYILKAFHQHAVQEFLTESDPRVQHGISTCVKAVMLQHCQASLLALSERCGAQGLFNYNQIVRFHVGTQ